MKKICDNARRNRKKLTSRIWHISFPLDQGSQTHGPPVLYVALALTFFCSYKMCPASLLNNLFYFLIMSKLKKQKNQKVCISRKTVNVFFIKPFVSFPVRGSSAKRIQHQPSLKNFAQKSV
jgi:hypothetical protein